MLHVTWFGSWLVLSPRETVGLNQKILESVDDTISHNTLHNSVFKKGQASLEQLPHQFQQKRWGSGVT